VRETDGAKSGLIEKRAEPERVGRSHDDGAIARAQSLVLAVGATLVEPTEFEKVDRRHDDDKHQHHADRRHVEATPHKP
jgi:hypothetical protein